MIRCVIEMFGLPYGLTELRKVEVELEDGANLGDVIGALRGQIPALEGNVIRRGENQLTEYYAFNINGYFYSDASEGLPLRGDSRMALLPIAVGG